MRPGGVSRLRSLVPGSHPLPKDGIKVSVETVNNAPLKDVKANTIGKWETARENPSTAESATRPI